jgi:SAM-dependent methyltransferase
VPSLDPRFSISGWNSSYTGAPIPDVEMREWLDDTVAAVLELTPRRVLEIGCGTGLVLFALAARCEHYCATDFSAAGLNHVSQHLTPDEASRVRLLQRPADDFADLGPGAYDVVILNSVVQYFPSIEYLMRVLEGAASVLAPGGSIFLGDVRSLPLLEAFHVSVEAHRAASSMSTDQLRQRVRRRMLQEQELVVDPAFFEALPKWIPSIRSADIRRKRGRSENELTRFRYDVVLHTATHPGRSDRRWVTWAADDVASTTIPELIESRTAIGLRNVPDRLLAPSIRMRNLLAGTRAPATVGDLRHAVGLAPMATQTVDDLCRTAAELGCNVHLAYSTDRASECVDVLLTPPGVEARANEWEPARGAVKPESLHQYANNPLHGIAAQRLVPELREFLKTRLPDYMVPAAFVLLDTMPLTPSGKIDRRALPPPDTTRPDLDEAYVSPRNAVEDALADIWRQVLGVEEVGVRDNFFDIGGDSILSIQIVSRANQSGLRMSPQDVFQHQTIAELAAVARPAGFVASEQHVIVGSVPLTPIQRWFLDKDPVDPHFFNQAVLLSLEQGSNAPLISRALSAVFTHHDALRLLFIRDEHGWTERHVEHDAAVQIVRLNTASLTAEDERATIERTAAELNASFDLATGPLVCAALFDAGLARRGHLLIVAHHLVIDGVSWRILLEDVQQASAQLSRGEPIRLPAKTTSFKTWAERLVEYAQSSTVASEMPYWLGIITAPRVPLPRDIDHPGFGSDQSTRTCVVTLTVNQTRALLRDVPAAYHTQMNDVLVTALAQAFARWTGE